MVHIGHVVQGAYNNIADKQEELYQKRISVCRGCAELINSLLGETCNACGCIMSWKARVPNEKCKLGKWGAEV